MINKLFIIIALLVCTRISAQEVGKYPEVGKPIPDFVLTNIKYFSTNEINGRELTGKHTILDFWNKYCVSCIRSFPKVNELAAKYQGRVNIALVGLQEEGIEDLYEKNRERLDLTLPAAFDSVLYRRFVPGGAPHLIWIDDEGIVQAVTGGSELTEANIEAFINGKSFPFTNTSHKANLDMAAMYDFFKPFLIDGNGGKSSEFLYRSLLAEYKPGMPTKGAVGPIDEFIQFVQSEHNMYEKYEFEAVWSLPMLYTYAYIGNTDWYYGDSLYSDFYINPLVVDVDSSRFFPDVANGDNMYWYSLIVPPSKLTANYLLTGIQRDLDYYFGYEVKVEKRKMPYLRIVAKPDARRKLETKGGEEFVDPNVNNSWFKGTNIPLERFLKIFCYLTNQGLRVPFVDETGIDYHIDIDVDIVYQSFEDIRKVLNKVGLDVERGEREYKVLVIRDPKPKSENVNAQLN